MLPNLICLEDQQGETSFLAGRGVLPMKAPNFHET